MTALVDRSVLKLACGKQQRYQLLRSIRAQQAFLFFYQLERGLCYCCRLFAGSVFFKLSVRSLIPLCLFSFIRKDT